MSSEHPDRDSLTAFLEEALSIDATQWMEHHLRGCAQCRTKLDEERAFLAQLDSLGCVEPPADFVQGVMARVAQYPAYSPAQEVPWRRVGLWTGSAAALLLVLVGFVGWALVNGAPVEGTQTSSAIVTGAEWAKNLYFTVRENTGGLLYVFQIGGTVLFGIFDFVRNSGLMVQLALLLATVLLNYAFTRMVLNYQRRQ